MLKILNEYEKAYENIKNFVQDEDNAEVWTKSYLLSLDEDLELIKKLVIKTINPTLEEVKKEWEELGYTWEEDDDDCIYIDNYKTYIRLYKNTKLYESHTLFGNVKYLTFQEHQLLTKTFKALGWYDE